MRNEEKLNKY